VGWGERGKAGGPGRMVPDGVVPEIVLGSAVVSYVGPNGDAVVCPLDAAGDVAFERCLPAREIPHRQDQVHTPSWHYSSTTNRMVEAESYLEKVWMKLLDFDPAVLSYAAQPMLIEGRDQLGSWKAFPDLFVRRADGSGTVMEVKDPSRIGSTKVRLAAARVAACAKLAGWGYELVGAPPGRQETVNVLTLAAYRRRMLGVEEYRERMLSLARDPVALGDLIGFVGDDDVARAVALHLCWTRELSVDLARPLEDSSLVQAAR